MDFVEFTGKKVEDAITEATQKFGTPSDQLEIQIISEGSTGFLGLGSKPAVIKVRKKETVEDKVRTFLVDIMDKMNFQVEILISYDEENGLMDIELKGPEMGILIGKRGQTLDSLQYLCSLVVNKESDKYIKVKLDTENYRKRRKDTLENLARNIAFKVKRTKKAVSLEPMNPYERRIIHSALQNDRYVTTQSEGEDPYRHVVIFLKK